MSYDIYYTIRSNEKEHYKIQTLFNDEKYVYDYPRVFDTEVYNTWEECLNAVYKKKLINVHIRRHISTSGYYDYTDYLKGAGYFKGELKYVKER